MNIDYRPGIQNGRIARRPRSITPFHRSPRLATPPRRQHPLQLRALYGLIVCGALITAGFLFSLHQHFTASAFVRDATRLKVDLDRLGSEQRHIAVEQTRAGSPATLERATGQHGRLAPVKLDTPADVRVAPVKEKSDHLSHRDDAPSGSHAPSQRGDD